MRIAAQPRLYDAETDFPVLRGSACSRCGRVCFPPLEIGCEVCGADDARLVAAPLMAVGIAFALAEVHAGPGENATPFTVVEVVLDDGPLVRAMVHPESLPVQIGDRVVARWSVIARPGDGPEAIDEVVEPAFEVATVPNEPDA